MDKRIAKALTAVAKKFPDMPEIQRETLAAVMVLEREGTIATMEKVAETAGNVAKVQCGILADLVSARVLENPGLNVYTLANVKRPAPKLQIVASAPVNILDPAFLNPGPVPVSILGPVDVDHLLAKVASNAARDGDTAVLAMFGDADKGPETGPVAQAMLATAGMPDLPVSKLSDEDELTMARRGLKLLDEQREIVKREIRTIRARMRAAGKVVPEGDKRDKAPATSRSERPETGRVLTAAHKGIAHEVIVNATDFTYDGESYKSLSAIGRKITGWQTCDGGLLFGLRKRETGPATPRAPRAVNASPAVSAKPAPLGFGAAIAAVKVASTPPAAVPAPEVTAPSMPDRAYAGGAEDPILADLDAPKSTPGTDPFLVELETLGNVATPTPAPKVATGKRAPRTFGAPRNA